MSANQRESQRGLWTAPLRDFIRVRDALVRELRAQGETEEAKAVAGLRKPPVGLWIANQLARLAPAEVKALIEATARLRQGQSSTLQGASGNALRDAMRDQREALARLTDAAGRAAREAGTKLTLELQRRVQNTVQAAAASEPEALSGGSLAAELQPSGFEGLLGAAPRKQGEPASPKHDAAAAAAAKRDHSAEHPRKKDEADAARTRKEDEADARIREKKRARALLVAEEEAHRLNLQAQKLAEIAAGREQEAARAREQAEGARRRADEAAERAIELREQRASITIPG